jgi:hypothetical protein
MRMLATEVDHGYWTLGQYEGGAGTRPARFVDTLRASIGPAKGERIARAWSGAGAAGQTGFRAPETHIENTTSTRSNHH